MKQQAKQFTQTHPTDGAGGETIAEVPAATHAAMPGDPLAKVARAQIASRLRAATELVEHGIGHDLPAVRTLLEEAMDRTDAWVVARLCGANDSGGDRPAMQEPAGDDAADDALGDARGTRLRMSLLAQTRGEPVDEFLLIPFGRVSVERPVAGGDFAFTRKHAESAVGWFEQIGRKLAIDYEHQSFEQFNTRPDGLRPAAGWIGGLEVRGDGLWATSVTWTDRARELLRSGEYRYFSPVIYWTDKEYSDVAGLGPVALTNDPAMHGVRPLAARRADASVAPAEGGEAVAAAVTADERPSDAHDAGTTMGGNAVARADMPTLRELDDAALALRERL